jgi:hypothetical protein
MFFPARSNPLPVLEIVFSGLNTDIVLLDPPRNDTLFLEKAM